MYLILGEKNPNELLGMTEERHLYWTREPYKSGLSDC